MMTELHDLTHTGDDSPHRGKSRTALTAGFGYTAVRYGEAPAILRAPNNCGGD